MKVLMLAGGYAKRLGELGERVPKPLLPLSSGVTVLDYIVGGLEEFFPQENMVLTVNEKFRKDFEDWARKRGFRGKILVEPHSRDEEKFGTVRALAYAISELRLNEDLFVIACDNVIFPFLPFIESTLSLFDRRSVVIGVYRTEPEKIAKRFGNVVLEGKLVKDFVEKPEEPLSPYAAMAVYIFPAKLKGRDFGEVLKDYLKEGNPDSPGNLIAYLVRNGYSVLGSEFSGQWWDVGKIEDWKSALEFFERNHPGP